MSYHPFDVNSLNLLMLYNRGKENTGTCQTTPDYNKLDKIVHEAKAVVTDLKSVLDETRSSPIQSPEITTSIKTYLETVLHNQLLEMGNTVKTLSNEHLTEERVKELLSENILTEERVKKLLSENIESVKNEIMSNIGNIPNQEDIKNILIEHGESVKEWLVEYNPRREQQLAIIEDEIIEDDVKIPYIYSLSEYMLLKIFETDRRRLAYTEEERKQCDPNNDNYDGKIIDKNATMTVNFHNLSSVLYNKRKKKNMDLEQLKTYIYIFGKDIKEDFMDILFTEKSEVLKTMDIYDICRSISSLVYNGNVFKNKLSMYPKGL